MASQQLQSSELELIYITQNNIIYKKNDLTTIKQQ